MIGVKDNGSISGIRSEEEKYMVQTAAEFFCQPEVAFEAKEWTVNGKTILEVIVPKSKFHKHKAPDHSNIYKVYTRVKDQNILADSILLKIWKYQNNKQNVKITFNEAEMFLLKYLNENKKITVRDFIEKANVNKKEAERILVNFTLTNVIKYEITEKVTFFTLFEE